MKSFTKFLALGAVLAASASVAFADPITGSFSLDGTSSTVSTSNGSTVTILSSSVQGALTGTFASYLTDGQTVNFPNPNLSFSNGTNSVPDLPILNVVGTGGETFTLSATGYTEMFLGTGNAADLDVYDGTGFLTAAGYDPTAATFSFETQLGGDTTFSAMATGAPVSTSVTPEPNSLVLMGTGLIGAAGMLFMRRRNANGLV